VAKSGGNRRTRRKQAVPESAREEQSYDPGEWVYFNSSRVYRARYDRKNMIVELQWMKPGLNYVYLDVPPNVWRNMGRVVSVGKFVNRVLNQYNYAPKVD